MSRYSNKIASAVRIITILLRT